MSAPNDEYMVDEEQRLKRIKSAMEHDGDVQWSMQAHQNNNKAYFKVNELPPVI